MSIQFPNNPNIHVLSSEDASGKFAMKEDVAANTTDIAELSTTTTNLSQSIQTLDIKDGETQTKIGNLQNKTQYISTFSFSGLTFMSLTPDTLSVANVLQAGSILFKKTEKE